MKIFNLFISSILLFSFLIHSKPLPKLKIIKDSHKSIIAPSSSSQKNIEKPDEYYDKLVEIGARLDNLTNGQPHYSYYEKINYKEDKKNRKKLIENLKNEKKKRKLSESQILENVGFVDLYQSNSYSNATRASKFLMTSIKKDESKFILYPYPFKYTDQEKKEKEVEYGGFFSLNQTLLTGKNFEYLQNISTVQIGKAKGIYDIDIAIMSIVYTVNGKETDLFTEANSFCEYFVSTLSKISSCLEGKNGYLEYKSNYPTKGSVVRISEKDLLNETLYDSQTNQLKFKLLIISDYLTGNEETILNKYVTVQARNIIKKFRELGGHIITSGKAGYLLELMGIISEGTYDNSFTLGTSNKNSENKIYGCEDIYKNNPDEQPDYFKQLICLAYKKRTYLSQTFTMKKLPENFGTLIEYTNEEKTLLSKIDGRETNINDVSVKYPYIVVSKEEVGKGRIMLVNGNPVKNLYYFENVRNMILYSMSSNVIYDLKIKFNLPYSDGEEDFPIPAGEEGVQIVSSYKLYNLAKIAMTNVEINILLAKKIKLVTNFESGDICIIKEDSVTYADLDISSIDTSKYIKCTIPTLDKLSSVTKEFKIEITDYSITSLLNDIPLMYSKVKYTDGEINKDMLYTPGIFYAQAALAAVLRGTINKDPTSYYPQEGWGLYFDLVLNIQNKENTEARNVSYISLIPLVSPLFDGEDEGSVAKVIPLYENYYENHNYSYPWLDVNNRGVDYIDYVEVANKGVCYVSDYDTPSKWGKVTRSSLEGIVDNLFEPHGNAVADDYAGLTKATNANSLLKQIYFADNEKFYETASPRISLFINTATKEGAEAMFGNNIPADLVDPHDSTKTKTQYAFIRVDTYFYNSIFGQYQLPDGFDDKVLISIDRFDQSSLTPDGDSLSDIKRVLVNKGHYDSSKERYNRLKPNEYANSLRQLKFMKQYDPTKPEELEALQQLTKSKVYMSHYMVPFTDNTKINNADSIIGFQLDPSKSDGSGFLTQYPSVKFVKGHSIELILEPEITRLGGKTEIQLPSGVSFEVEEPIEKEESITTSADNVAFYKTEYDKTKNIITLFFKRGLMPNENYGQPSKCKVFIENLNKKENFDVTIKIYDFKYDFSKENIEAYEEQKTKEVTASYIPFFSLPCLYIENKLTRTNEFSNEEFHEMSEYELMDPFARYGGYFQELTKHTSVYGSAEAHHVKRPGFQSTSGGFSLLSNIGTSSIPFAEFLEHGKLAIPGVISTSRLEWKDIWGRSWAQNLRSVYPDIPPIPPAPLSYIMTTTFELITNDYKQERVLEWKSDESVYIRIQMKVRNTYKLYWEPTICKGNQISFMKESYGDYRNPTFLDYQNLDDLSTLGDDYDVNLGFTPQYGVCYSNTNSYLNGIKVNDSIINTINEMTSCSDSLDAAQMTACSKEFDKKYTDKNIPIVKTRPNTITDEQDKSYNKNWNYSPLIEGYLPEGYIHSNKMWQLTLEPDYSDDSFWKGYPWHLDNCIPNLDNGVTKPQDLIAFPIYKGLGYNITYSKDYSIKKFSQYKGWWSDQLQNKDHTLLAGQQKVNKISVGQDSLLKDSDWINAFNLKNTKKTNLVTNRLKNIYVCKYNQNRVKVKPGQSKYSFLKNVYQNNVVPVLPDLAEDDERYNNFQCTGEDAYQYTIYNISQADNRVYTGNDRDWLYFAAGLRSNARENINVILKLDPLEGSKYEGITKIQDGGRFTYWQPPDGPNSYQYYDGNINTVLSDRVDLSMIHKLYPVELNTFNTYEYQLFSIADKKEENREYTMNTYMNSHGYGDATTTVYVGGTDRTSCKVNPGEYTFVKITFYNNAGFDWVMTEEGITMNSEGYSAALNGMSIMTGSVTAIQYPKEYNFMSYIIPEEIKPYITLTPSQHLKDISPQFFDLTFNNVLEIKDALEGDYYYMLNVTDDFPDKYKGKLWEIKMKLNEKYFKTLPGVNDPTDVHKVHDYHITIPSIKFGVPYNGKIFYNLGQAKDMYFTYKIYKNFKIEGIKLITDDEINELSLAVVDDKNKYSNLENVWTSIKDTEEISKKIKITVEPFDSFYQLVKVNLSEAYPLFPYEVQNKPFVSNISFLVKASAEYVPHGYRNHLIQTRVYYNDGRKTKNNYADAPLYINCRAAGPSLVAEFNNKVVKLNKTSNEYYEIDLQDIYRGDEKTIKLTVTITNEGTSTAYNIKFSIGINPNANYINDPNIASSLTCKDEGIIEDYRKISINYDRHIDSSDNLKFDLYFEMQFGEKSDTSSITRNLEEEDKILLVKSLNLTLCTSDKKCVEGEPEFGREITESLHSIKYITTERNIGNIKLKSENIGTDLMPKYVLTAEITDLDSSYDLSTVIYSFKRKIEGKDDRFVEIASTFNKTIIDIPFEEGEINETLKYKVTYKVIGEFPDGTTLDSMNQNQVIFSYTLPIEGDDLEGDEVTKKGGLPLYTIILIIVIGLAALVAGGFLLYKLVLKKKNNLLESEFELGKQNNQIDDTQMKGKKMKRSIKNTSKVISFDK